MSDRLSSRSDEARSARQRPLRVICRHRTPTLLPCIVGFALKADIGHFLGQARASFSSQKKEEPKWKRMIMPDAFSIINGCEIQQLQRPTSNRSIAPASSGFPGSDDRTF
jgi:hypothetical protein